MPPDAHDVAQLAKVGAQAHAQLGGQALLARERVELVHHLPVLNARGIESGDDAAGCGGGVRGQCQAGGLIGVSNEAQEEQGGR